MKKLVLAICLLPFLSFAQKTYTVGAKETLFSIGRTLNIHPRELAEFNNIKLEEGVKVGQVLKIPAVRKMAPLSDNPAAPATTAVAATTTTSPVKPVTPSVPAAVNATKPAATVAVPKDMTPVYHKVQKKETLFQIAQTEKVSVDDIKKWNKLGSEGVNEGANLIVGYRKKESVAVTAATPAPKPAPEPVAAPAVVKKEEPKPAEKPAATVETDSKPASGVVRNFNGGFFKLAFAGQNEGKAPSNNENGLAAMFKSTSGWNDGKYYCLHNTAPAGTIIKVVNKSNQKYIYAKVLDVIPDLKQNEGLLIRLSNAAADELGAGKDVFDVALSY